MSEILSVRLDEDHMRFLRWHAEQRGITVSDVVRSLVAQLPAAVVVKVAA